MREATRCFAQLAFLRESQGESNVRLRVIYVSVNRQGTVLLFVAENSIIQTIDESEFE
jgi:hypothetical protein